MAKHKAKETRTSTPDPRGDTRLPLEGKAVWIALAVLAVLLTAFFAPLVLGGKTFLPPDELASRAHQPYLQDAFQGPGSLLDRYPLWTPYIFSGMPSFGSLIAAPYTNPMSLALAWIPGHLKLVVYYLLVGIGTWWFLRRRGVSNGAAVFGGVAYVFCTHLITLIMYGHNSKIATLVFLPFVLTATDALWRKPTAGWTAFLALLVGTMILTSHIQIAYYTLLAAGLYLLVGLIARVREKAPWSGTLVRLGCWGLGLLGGLAASAVVTLPVREYARFSIRGAAEGGGLAYDYATGWSLHPLETTTFFVPSILGYGGETYWGWMPFTDFPHYMGILVLALAVFTVATWPRERTNLFLAVLGGIALLLSFGRHLPFLYDLFFHYLPYFDKFRVPSMITVLLQFAVAALAAIGLDRVVRGTPGLAPATARRRFLVSVGVVGGITVALGAWAASGMMDASVVGRIGERLAGRADPQQIAAYAAGIADQVKDKAGIDFLRGLVILGLGSLVLYRRLQGKLSNALTVGLVLLLTVVDLWAVDRVPMQVGAVRYEERGGDPEALRPTPGVQVLQAQTGLYRVLPLGVWGSNGLAYFRIPIVTGYQPAKLQVYAELTDDRGTAGLTRPITQGNFNIVDMLNTRFLITDPRTGEQLTRIDPQRFGLIHQDANEAVVENRGALPRAWFVDRVRVVEDADAHLAAVADPAWNPAEEAILFADPGPVGSGEGATVEITDHRPREIRARVTSPRDALLVLSEIWYPAGWHAELDGAPVEIRRADFALRAVRIPEGEHELVLRFDPASFRTGVTLSLASYSLIALALLGSGVGALRRRRG